MFGTLPKLFASLSLRPLTTLSVSPALSAAFVRPTCLSPAFVRPMCSSRDQIIQNYNEGSPFWPKYDRLLELHLKGPFRPKRPNKNPLGAGIPMAKGVVIRTLVKKPRKPNSGNRKCVLVKLSNGSEEIAYVPGEGHNLQEHSTVLVKTHRLRDVPGVKLRCVRGAYDLAHVIKKKQ